MGSATEYFLKKREEEKKKGVKVTYKNATTTKKKEEEKTEKKSNPSSATEYFLGKREEEKNKGVKVTYQNKALPSGGEPSGLPGLFVSTTDNVWRGKNTETTKPATAVDRKQTLYGVKQRIKELEKQRSQAHTNYSTATNNRDFDGVRKYQNEINKLTQELERLTADYDELKDYDYQSDYKRLTSAAEEAEKALNTPTETGRTIADEVEYQYNAVEKMEEELTAKVAAYEANPTEEGYLEAEQLMAQFNQAVSNYNELYGRYEEMYDAYTKSAGDYNEYISMYGDMLDQPQLRDATWKDLLGGSFKRGYYNSLYGMESAKEMMGGSSKKPNYGKGNIDLNNRPVYRNSDGSISTVDSASFNIDGKEVLLPSVWLKDGKPYHSYSDEEILQHYYETGEYLGIFNTPQEADAYAEQLHADQEKYYNSGSRGYYNILQGDEYQFETDSWWQKILSGGMEQAGQLAYQASNPYTLSAIAAAGGAAAIAGQLGPQVLAPEELFTVPGAVIAAFKASSATTNVMIEAGLAYQEMRQLGVSDGVATAIAAVVGGANGKLEELQLDELVKAYKAVGGKKGLETTASLIGKALGKMGIDVFSETGQEILQEASTMAGTQLASKLDKGEWAYTGKEMAERLGDTALSSMLTFGGMNLPATTMNIASGMNTQRQLRNVGSDYQVAAKEIIEEGLSMPENTEAHQTAAILQQKLDAGQTLTNAELGRAVVDNERTIRKQAAAMPENSPQETLEQLARETVAERENVAQAKETAEGTGVRRTSVPYNAMSDSKKSAEVANAIEYFGEKTEDTASMRSSIKVNGITITLTNDKASVMHTGKHSVTTEFDNGEIRTAWSVPQYFESFEEAKAYAQSLAESAAGYTGGQTPLEAHYGRPWKRSSYGDTQATETVPYNVMSEQNPVRQATLAQQAAQEAEKIDANYGENGTDVFEAYMAENPDADHNEMVVRFDKPYRAGLTGLPIKKANLVNQFQVDAFNAGRKDRILQAAKDEKHVPVAILSEEESGFDHTGAPKDVRQDDRDFMNWLAKKLGAQGGWDGDPGTADGSAYNAFFDPESKNADVRFAPDFGISSEDMEYLGSTGFMEKVDRLSTKRSESVIFYAAHEMAGHVAMDRAPKAMRAFVDGMTNYLVENGKPQDSTRLKQMQYGARGVALDVTGATEEVAFNNILLLYDGDEQKFKDSMRRIYNSLDETGKEGARIYLQNLKDFIAKLKAWVRKLTGKENAEVKANVEQGISELEQLRDLFEAGIAEAMREVKKAREGNKADIAEVRDGLGTGAVIQTNKNGDMLLAKSKDGSKVLYSWKTYQKGGKDKLRTALLNNGHTRTEIDAVLAMIDDAADYLKILAAGYAKTHNYTALHDHLIADITTNLKTGKQVMSALVNNGDYPVNIDLALICKKRVAYMNLMTRLIEDGIFDMVDYKGEAIADVNEILRANNFETACLGCFVESRRLQFQTWAETIASEWNDEVRKRKKNPKAFGFAKGYATLTDAEMDALTRELENAGKKNKQGNLNLGTGSVKTKIGRLLDMVPSLQQTLTTGDLLTPTGLAALRAYDANLFSIVKSRYGAASPKIVQDFNPYASEIAMMTFKSVSDITSNAVKGAQDYIKQAKKDAGGVPKKNAGETDAAFKKRKAEWNAKVEADAMRSYLYDIGGARCQSFSDFMIENVFDYLQIFADLAANRFPLHGYTKEIICLRLFGMSGAKWNGSLIAHTDRKMGKEYAGLLPAEAAKDGSAILVHTEEGDYAIGFDDYARNKATKGESFIQSIGIKDIVALQLDPRYSANVGSITIGVSDKQILAMLDNPLFSMVIPYHSSGMLPGFAQRVGVDMYNDYTDYQNTSVKQLFDVNGNRVEELIGANGKAIKIDTSYAFNAEVQKTGDARQAADNYIKWCGERHPVYDGKKLAGYATFNPKFSDSPYGTDFSRHPNYYKLLEDFASYDSVTGASALQGGVTMTFPAEENRLTAAEMAAYKRRLRDTGLFTEQEIAKYEAIANKTFKELIADEVKGRAAYKVTQDAKWEKTVKEIKDKLMSDYARPEGAKKYSFADVFPNEAKGIAKSDGQEYNGSEKQHNLKEDIGNGRETDRGRDVRKEIAGGEKERGTVHGGRAETSDRVRPGISSPSGGLGTAPSFGEEPNLPFAKGGVITPGNGSIAQAEQRIAMEYGVASFVISDKVLEAIGKKAPAFAHDGQVYFRETLSEEESGMYAVHEICHVMKQTKYAAYLDFVDRTPDMINMSDKTAMEIMDAVDIHIEEKYKREGKVIDKDSEEYIVDLFDEFNADIYGIIVSGKGDDFFSGVAAGVLYDFDAYRKELTEIHNRFKQDNNAKRNAAADEHGVQFSLKDSAKKAKEYFGTTTDMYSAGYLLTDGTMLSNRNEGNRLGWDEDWFNEVGDHIDHHVIFEVYGNKYDYDPLAAIDQFVSEGNVRLVMDRDNKKENVIEISGTTEPTAAQYEMISRFAEATFTEGKSFSVGYSGQFKWMYRNYESDAKVSSVTNDIKYYFANGEQRRSPAQFSLKDSTGRNLSEGQQEYFKDSVVRDAAGNLLVMYHGTSNFGFTVFDTYASRFGLFGQGSYFTDNRSVAESYQEKGKGDKPGVYSVYLNIKEPLDMDAPADIERWRKAFRAHDLDESYLDGVNTGEDAFRALKENLADEYVSRAEAIETVTDLILSMKYDGITHIGGGRFNKKDETRHRVYIIFESEQAKSIDNRNPTDHYDINMSLKGEEDMRNEIKRIRAEGQKAGKAAAEIDAEIAGVVSRQYTELLKVYGEVQRGERPAREIKVPQRTGKNRHVSQTIRTILEAGATPDAAVPTIQQLITQGDFSFERITDEGAMADAEATIKSKGYNTAMAEWLAEVKKGTVSKHNTALGWALYNAAANAGDLQTAMTILNGMVQHQRSAAQALQATRILKKMAPDAQLYGVQRSVENLQEELEAKYGKKAPKLKVNEDLARKFLDATSEEERAAAEAELYKDIGRQIPPSWLDKWNAWRYLAMLGNPRTHVRNIVGNMGFAPVVAAKNLVATGVEKIVYFVSGGKLIRSKGMPSGELLKAAWDDYVNVAAEISAGGKYNDAAIKNQNIEEGRQIFKLKPLEKARKGNTALMEKEDVWFARPHYAFALAQYCKAHGVTVAQLRAGKALGNGRNYAIREAQKATYRDTNQFSEAISQLGRYQGDNKAKKAISVVAEGILPFRKTPANILARGIEYSPIGLVKSLTFDLVRVKNGEITGAEAIDNFAAGFTGTALLAAGAWLAAEGLLRGAGGGDEEEKKFEELQGHQAYALELPDGTSITLDWLAPEVLPLFIGANLVETARENKGHTNLADILTAISNVTDPLLEMSCLQSLNDLFDSVGYAASGSGLDALPTILVSAATSYLTQGLPTLLGQFERSSQDERMTTYTEKNNFLTGDLQYTIGNASARIPGWDFRQIPYVDAWGRTESTGTKAANAANNFLNPAYMSDVATSEMEQELQRLHGLKGDEYSVLPDRAAKYFNVGGDRKDLTAEEYLTYATEKGQLSRELLTDLTGRDEYKDLPDAEKARAVELAYEYANAIAKTSVSNYEPDGWVAGALKAEDYSGMDEVEYILYKMALNMADTANTDGAIGSYDNAEKAAAIAACDWLTDKDIAAVLDSKTGYAAYDAGLDMRDFMEYAGEGNNMDVEKLAEAKKAGIGMDTFFGYADTLKSVDQPNKNGEYGGTATNAEKAAAVAKLGNVSDQEIAFLWGTEQAQEAHSYGVNMRAYAQFKGAVGNFKGENKQDQIKEYLNSMEGLSYKDWLYLYGTVYSSVKDDADYLSYFGK